MLAASFGTEPVARIAVVGIASLFALGAWTLERAAIGRLRWIMDPTGDPRGPLRAWPALRTLVVMLIVQALAILLFLWIATHLVQLPFAVVLLGAGLNGFHRRDIG